MQRKPRQPGSVDDRELLLHIVIFVLIVWATLSVAWRIDLGGGWYQVSAGVAPFGLCAALAIGLLLMIKKRTSRWLFIAMRTVAVATIIVVALLSIGFIQTLLGIQCPGLFGGPSNCFETWPLWISFALLNPLTLLLGVLAMIILFGGGIADSVKG